CRRGRSPLGTASLRSRALVGRAGLSSGGLRFASRAGGCTCGRARGCIRCAHRGVMRVTCVLLVMAVVLGVVVAVEEVRRYRAQRAAVERLRAMAAREWRDA